MYAFFTFAEFKEIGGIKFVKAVATIPGLSTADPQM